MKILFVTPYYKPYLGGIERVIEKLAHSFVHHFDYEQVNILTSSWSFPRKHKSNWAKTTQIDQETIYRLSSWPSFALPFYQIPLVWFSPLEIRKYLHNHRPDIIQLMSDRWFWVNFWVLVWAKLEKIPVVYSLSFHQLSNWQQFLRPINAFLTLMADRTHVITEHEKSLVKKSYFSAYEKFIVIPWGVDFPQNAVAKKQGSGEVKIICVGRISEHKGQLWLSQIYQRANLNYPSELILIGAIEDEQIRMKIENIDLPKNKRIRFYGHVSDDELEKIYQEAEIFALFSDYEAFGLVFLEAMVHQVPVLTHKVGAIRQVLGSAAYLTDKWDKTQAQQAVEKLVNYPDLRHELAQRGADYVWSHYSWEKCAAEFNKLYQRLLK